MVFNSLHFAVFFAVVYALYLALGKRWRVQNALLLAAGYVFYSFWDWRFLGLIIFSSAFNFHLGNMIASSGDDARRKRLLVYDVALNLAILAVFKYFNFFTRGTLNIILPLGISFYTFQVMSYAIDIYRRAMKPTTDPVAFALFVSFFPLVASGPIERARNMLPQIEGARETSADKFYKGSWLFFFGLFKKLVIADNLAGYTAWVFGTPGHVSGATAAIVMYLFAIQVYADFSGYSDMARGISKAMGFEVMLNFRTPFFSTTIPELWQRWHISLTTWIKEYLYYPLALAEYRGRQLAPALVVIITWALMGLWHGPYWKFVVWGVYHGILIVSYSRLRPYLARVWPRSRALSGALSFAGGALVFSLFSAGLLFFACPSASSALASFMAIFVKGSAAGFDTTLYTIIAVSVLPVAIVEWAQFARDDEFVTFRWPFWLRAVLYYALFYILVFYGDFHAQKYYYFQF